MKRRLGRAAFAAIAALAVTAASAVAQGLATGVVAGRISDAESRPLADVVITIEPEAAGRRVILRSGRDGRYTVPFLDAGRYVATFERIGFAPARVEGIIIGPGERVELPVALRAAGSIPGPDVRQASAALSIFGPSAPGHWVSSDGASALPLEGGGLEALAVLSSRFASDLGVDGLPGSMTQVVIDGVPASPRPDRLARFARDAAFPLTALAVARTLPSAVDAEWPGSAGGYVLGLNRAGGSALAGMTGGEWAGDALAGGEAPPSFNAFRAAAWIGGPIVRDTSAFAAGVEYLRSEQPFSRPWTLDPATAAVVSAAAGAGAPVPEAEPLVSSIERLAAWGRADLTLGESSQLSLSGNVALLPVIDPLLAADGRLVRAGTAVEGREIFASARLVTEIGDEMTNEVDVRFESSRVAWDPAGDSDLPLRATVLSAGRAFGAADQLNGEQTLLGLYLRETLFFEGGAHALKLGAFVDLPSYEVGGAQDERGAFVFDSPESIVARRGVFERISGVPQPAEIGFRRLGVFAQDAWSPAPGLEVAAGFRISVTRMPDTANLSFDQQWFEFTDHDNRTIITQRVASLEPRIGIRWRPNPAGAWVVGAYAQIDAGPVDPGLIAEVFRDDGVRTVFRGVGDLGGWPLAPDTFRAGSTGRRLVVLGPRFRGPESTRAGASLAWQLGAGGALAVSFDLRRTRHLPRRRDVNRLPVEVAFDQHGRPVYGVMQKVGAALAAAPGSNQNFAEFDHIWAIEAIGESTYRGVTLSLERQIADALTVFGSYTFSGTEDDWPAPVSTDPYAQIDPFPTGDEAGRWIDGRSDFDVPHRLSAGVELRAPGRFGPRIAALYRFQSGLPFTPGYRDGVDANADGSAVNDPAYIDTGIPGMSEAVAAWPCLTETVNQLIERNACRGPDVHALDARMIIDIAGGTGYRAEIVLDALNLLASDYGVVDDALLLVDPDAPLGGGGSTVTVPLMANPDFGTLRTRHSPERLFRVGLRLRY